MKKRFLAASLVFFIISIFYILINFDIFNFISNNIKNLEYKNYNFFNELYYVFTKNKEKKSKNIVIFGVDDESFKVLNKRWPFDRKDFAKILNNIRKINKKKVIGLDFVFDTDSSYEDDNFFKESIVKNNPIVLAYKSGNSEEIDVKPIKILENSAKALGSINQFSDEDNFVRFLNILVFDEIYSIPFSLQLFLIQNNLKIKFDKKKKELLFFDAFNRNVISLPFVKSNLKENQYLAYMKFYKKSDFTVIPIHKIYNETLTEEEIDKIKNSFILLGPTSILFHDHFPTPLADKRNGIEIHANILNNLLLLMQNQNNFVNYLDKYKNYLIVVSLSTIFAFLFINFSAFYLFLLNIIYSIFIFFIGIWFFIQGIFFNTITAIISNILALIFIIAYKQLILDKEKREIKSIFTQYVSPNIVDKLLLKDKNVELGGKREKITTIFIDLCSFTTFSEKESPEKVVELLNIYFDEMTKIIFKNNGTIDKFIGDAIMIFFGAPLSTGDDEYFAVKTVYEMRKKISEIKENNENFNFDISCGVSTGYAVVGNIGSSKHKEYTVIGDSVNTAARLQGFAKDNQIIIDYDTYIKANEKNEFKFNDIGEIKVKGKEKKIKVYEILE